MSTSSIEVADVRKSFKLPHQRQDTFKERFLHPFRHVEVEQLHALRGVSFDIEEGEFFGIIGPNGSGKSTLLKLLAGIYVPEDGSITVRGRLSPFVELGVGFNEELSARDNVRVNGALLGLTLRQIEERYDEIVSFAGLERFMDQKLKNFSSGMKVRLAYSVSIRVEFRILLLDEVLAVGDQEFQKKCFETLDAIRAQGKTIVFVGHDMDAMEKHCDRVMHLHRGEIVGIGPADEIVERYRAAVPSLA
jgi:ABC-type polysaccharide/polyol phosphate transport system ATPase subunit